MSERIAIYPGTFDPITNGHLDITSRASKLFDTIVVAVSVNDKKNPLFTAEERKILAQEVVKDIPGIEVDIFNDLLMRYAESKGACAVIRGLRAVSDFEYEFQMALMNRKLNREIETVYLMPSEEFTYINSSIVKEVARYQGDVDQFLPKPVTQALRKKIDLVGE